MDSKSSFSSSLRSLCYRFLFKRHWGWDQQVRLFSFPPLSLSLSPSLLLSLIIFRSVILWRLEEDGAVAVDLTETTVLPGYHSPLLPLSLFPPIPLPVPLPLSPAPPPPLPFSLLTPFAVLCKRWIFQEVISAIYSLELRTKAKIGRN